MSCRAFASAIPELVPALCLGLVLPDQLNRVSAQSSVKDILELTAHHCVYNMSWLTDEEMEFQEMQWDVDIS